MLAGAWLDPNFLMGGLTVGLAAYALFRLRGSHAPIERTLLLILMGGAVVHGALLLYADGEVAAHAAIHAALLLGLCVMGAQAIRSVRT